MSKAAEQIPEMFCMQHPEFYAKTPPAPAGVEWWKLNPGVPPLPDPFTALGPDFAGYAWRYDDKYSAQSYTFSQLDKVCKEPSA